MDTKLLIQDLLQSLSQLELTTASILTAVEQTREYASSDEEVLHRACAAVHWASEAAQSQLRPLL